MRSIIDRLITWKVKHAKQLQTFIKDTWTKVPTENWKKLIK